VDRLEAYTGFLQVSLDEEAAAEAWAVERREAEAAARAAARRQQQQQQQQQATAAIAAAASASASGSAGVGAAAGSPHAPARRLSTAFPDAAALLRAAAAAAPAEDAGVILGGGVAAKATTGAVLEIQPQLMCVQIQYCPLLPSIAPPITPITSTHAYFCVLLRCPFSDLLQYE